MPGVFYILTLSDGEYTGTCTGNYEGPERGLALYRLLREQLLSDSPLVEKPPVCTATT